MRIPVTVRTAEPLDAEAIERVARASWRDTYGDIFDRDFIEGFLARNYDREGLAQATESAAADPTSEFVVAERDGEVVGYLQFGDGPDGPQLYRIYADPQHYGSGVGSALLAELHRRIDGRVESYVLDVHSRNARGRAFYDRNGFVIIGAGSTPDCELRLRRTLHATRPELPRSTDRLTLRELSDSDARALHRIYGDAETMRFVGHTGRPTADQGATARVLASLRRHAELHGFSLWAVDERDGDELVGVAGLAWVENHGPDVEAAYVLRRDRWGRGYASEALREVLRIGHDELGMDRIVALAYPENDASRRVMEKAGMVPDGTAEAYGHVLTRHVSVGQPS